MPAPDVAIARRARSRELWTSAAVLFIASAALLALRSMPSTMSGDALAIINWSVTGSFAFGCSVSAVALWPRGGATTVLRAASVTAALFGVWLLIRPILLSSFAGDSFIFIDALVRIVTAGIAVGCLARSNLTSPWRAVPAVLFGVVTLGMLLTQLTLTSPSTMDVALLAGSLLTLTQIAASIVLGVVALQFARVRRTSTPIM